MAKHTPGPWRRGSDDLRSPELFCEVYAPNGYLIARCNVGTARGKEGREATETARANAHLISVVPELLAMVETLSAYDSYETEYDGRMYSICPACSNQDGQHSDRCDFVLARALIAKATGEES